MNPIFTKYKYIKALEVKVAYLFFNFLRKWQEVHIESEAEACNVCSNHWGDEGNKEQHSPHRPDTEVFFLILGEAQVEKEKKEEEKEQALKSCRVLKKKLSVWKDRTQLFIQTSAVSERRWAILSIGPRDLEYYFLLLLLCVWSHFCLAWFSCTSHRGQRLPSRRRKPDHRGRRGPDAADGVGCEIGLTLDTWQEALLSEAAVGKESSSETSSTESVEEWIYIHACVPSQLHTTVFLHYLRGRMLNTPPFFTAPSPLFSL